MINETSSKRALMRAYTQRVNPSQGAVGLLVTGAMTFRRMERTFADVV